MVHLFKRLGHNIAVDVGSGAVHILTEEAAAVLTQLLPDEKISEEIPSRIITGLSGLFGDSEIKEAYSELYDLYKDGVLFSEDDSMQIDITLGSDSPIKAMCLNIAHDCNLRCKYCFASTGDFGEGRRLMDFDTSKKAIDFLIKRSEKRHNLEVDFFGGEPLLAFDVVKKTVEYARSIENQFNKRFRFTITTNGTLLDAENINYINSEMTNVVLSLDGRKNINDEMRGSGVHDAIVQNYKKLLEPREYQTYYIRGTFTRKNLDFIEDVKHILKLGFDEISIEPVIAKDTDYALKDEDIGQISSEYEKLAQYYIERNKSGQPFTYFHFLIDLEQGPCVIKRIRGCGAGNEYVAVTPDGDIYPCHQFIGNKKFIMGNVNADFNETLKKEFAEANISKKPVCMECWAKYYCSGGCNANNYMFNNSIIEPHSMGCELERIRIECALAIQAELLE